MKRRLKELAILLLTLALLGLLIVVSGVMPIKASTGHWPITRLFLDFASDRSIAFHSQGIEVPNLDEPGIIPLGAATYESNCRWCHGRPGQQYQPVAGGMTPKPPYLADAAQSFELQELFYIVKHGIIFAGMPAWPSQLRDEEIWPVCAFLKELPSLDADQYQQLITADAAENPTEPEMASQTEQLATTQCAVCHGKQGAGGVSPRVPVLAGQNEAYLRLALISFREANRFSGVMQPVASRLNDEQIVALAAYFASNIGFAHETSSAGGPAASGAGDAESDFPPSPAISDAWTTGRLLANRGDRSQKIPACVDCHGPEPGVLNSEYPLLAGQPAWYIKRQLVLFSSRRRGGSPHANLMHPVADKLDEQQRDALATYYHNPLAVVPR